LELGLGFELEFGFGFGFLGAELGLDWVTRSRRGKQLVGWDEEAKEQRSTLCSSLAARDAHWKGALLVAVSLQ